MSLLQASVDVINKYTAAVRRWHLLYLCPCVWDSTCCRFPEATAPRRQGITVVSDHRSTVLTYIEAALWTPCTISGTSEQHSTLILTLFWAAKVVHLADVALPALLLSTLSPMWSVGAWRRVKVLCQVLHHFNKHVLISTEAGKQTLSEVPRWQ